MDRRRYEGRVSEETRWQEKKEKYKTADWIEGGRVWHQQGKGEVCVFVCVCALTHLQL